MRVKIVILLSLCYYSVFCYSQDTINDFIRMNKYFEDVKSYNLSARFKMIKNKKSVVEFNETFIKNDSLLYINLDSMEYILGKDFNLNVNNHQKIIILSPPNRSALNVSLNPTQIGLDLTMYKKITFRNEDLKYNSYTIFPINASYEKVYCRFNKKTFFVDKVILYGKEDDISSQFEQIEISVIRFDKKPKLTDELFTFYKYFNFDKEGNMVCNEEYRGYKLINNIRKQVKK